MKVTTTFFAFGSRRWLWALMINVTLITHAAGHDGKPHHPGDLLFTWGLDPFVILGLVLCGGVYISGLRNIWRHAGIGRGLRRWEACAFAAGWVSVFIALVSPLHPLGEVLFSAHMTQHELLMLVAAPLIVLGKPVLALLWALPLNTSRNLGHWVQDSWLDRCWQWATKPLNAWVIHAISLWVWHIPALFQATLSSALIHTIQHSFFFGSALLFWWAIIQGGKGRVSYGVAALFVFTTSIHSGVLGALITFAGAIVYPAYSHTTLSWGLTPLEDQQLGGLIMWVPAGVVYIIAGLALCAGWISESDRSRSGQKDEIVQWKVSEVFKSQ